MKTLKALFLDKRFKIGFLIMLLIVVISLLSFFSPYEAEQWHVVPEEKAPSLKYLLGTTSVGQDVFWTLTFAIKNSLLLAVTTAFFSRIFAIFIGLISGFKGGKIDKTLMLIADSLIALPILPILILAGSILKEHLNPLSLGLILSFFGWAWDARVIRSQVLSLRERGFVSTALLSGMKPFKLVFQEFLPFILPIVFSSTLGNMIWSIGIEITLAVLGLTDLLIPTLGTMIHWALAYQALFLGIWWWIVFPVVMSILLFVSLYLLSLSINEYLDPRMRIQRIGKA